MKSYRITVNGTSYDVCVEELGEGAVAPAPMVSAPIAQPAPVASAPVASAPQPAPAPQSAPSGAAGNIKVEAPMPGKIVGIKVNVGDKVETNQVVAILEAMKMENEIVTPNGGTVASINVTNGEDVNSGDILITIAE